MKLLIWCMKKLPLLNWRVSKKRREENYTFNKGFDFDGGIIDRQKGSVKNLRLGMGKVGDMGCGAVSVFNVLKLLNIEVKFADVLERCEEILVFKGFFGCNAYRIGEVLFSFGVGCKEGFTRCDIGEARIFIARYWNGKTVFKGAHIVAGEVKDDGSVRIYNANKKHYESFEEFKKNKLKGFFPVFYKI